MLSTLNIRDPLFISSPNQGGLLYAHRHLLMPVIREDATGLALTDDGLLWCVQTAENPLLREVRHGQLNTISLGSAPLDLHDVLVDASDTYVVLTETNQVARLDKSFQVQECWNFGTEPDCSHVNCIAMFGGRLLASMFGSFETHRGYKGQTLQSGRVIDVHSGEILIDGLSQPHSLVVNDEQLWLCSSEDCTLHVYDRSFRMQQQILLPGYARGLAIGAHDIYVGISRSRNLKSDEVGTFETAVVAVLDRQTFDVAGYMPIPWNEIYDIRIAPSADVVIDMMASVWAFEREVMRPAALQELEQAMQLAEKDLVNLGQHAAAMESAWENAHQRAENLQVQFVETQTRLVETQTQLVEARGEIMKRDARISALEQVREELGQLKSSRSWRLTRPLRFITRTIRRRGLGADDRHKLLRILPWQKLIVAGKGGAAIATGRRGIPVQQGGVRLSEIALAAQSGFQRDFFVWAVIDWHFRIQRPQHLARELSMAGCRVFYISNQFIDHAEPGFSVEALDDVGCLFQIRLHLHSSPAIYHASPDTAAQAQLRAGMQQLLMWTGSRACGSLIQHPYWLEVARILPNQRIVYDCMDHHGGFADNSDEVLVREHELMRDADLLVVTSDWLHAEAGKYNQRRLMVRNACQYEHFATRPERAFRDSKGRKVIGYYGAIAEWFDLDLVEKVARRFNDCLVLLVGADTCGAQQRLQRLDNVEFTGEVAYTNLPYYLHGFDLCMLPFLVVPLTLATNPVKVYEYLSAGKDVVSIELPEIHQFGGLVRTGTDHETFLQAVSMALAAPADPGEIARRQQFAAEQTWSHRVDELLKGIHALPEPKVSVVVVTYNNLDLTKLCLHSLEQYSDYENLEVIVVDNASADDTPAWLTEWVKDGHERHIVLNPDNRGFAAANNQGLAMASGDYLVMLNNDTYVTPGWVATLAAHLKQNPSLGILGPVTNNIGNEARIEIHYDSMDEMLRTAADYTTRHAGQLTPLHTAAFFCVMMPRAVHEKVGSLDEAFGIGFFEDDDYCRRVEQAGWTIACADDVFVHHNLSASFNKLKQEKRQALFEKNKAIYEAKWGAWVPHGYRGS